MGYVAYFPTKREPYPLTGSAGDIRGGSADGAGPLLLLFFITLTARVE